MKRKRVYFEAAFLTFGAVTATASFDDHCSQLSACRQGFVGKLYRVYASVRLHRTMHFVWRQGRGSALTISQAGHAPALAMLFPFPGLAPGLYVRPWSRNLMLG